ncbi:hypothetical protein [Pseudooctadecabacter sp.]|uniref:hypothetical protein n=1 Tax=Pseudooctadecabacter sp. TaxID=1966338 RepID=UPI0025D2B887|nr:hypothetical protein [Pseudooctadecabacter sp.]
MSDLYGPIKKSPMSLLLFAVPALAVVGIAVAISVPDAETFGAAFMTPTVFLSAVLAIAALIWGGIFISRPVITLTPEGVEWPDGRKLAWAQITAVDAGQEVTNAPSQNGGNRETVHEVTRLFHGDGDQSKITTTWAEIGPDAANDRIAAAFAHSRQAQ